MPDLGLSIRSSAFEKRRTKISWVSNPPKSIVIRNDPNELGIDGQPFHGASRVTRAVEHFRAAFHFAEIVFDEHPMAFRINLEHAAAFSKQHKEGVIEPTKIRVMKIPGVAGARTNGEIIDDTECLQIHHDDAASLPLVRDIKPPFSGSDSFEGSIQIDRIKILLHRRLIDLQQFHLVWSRISAENPTMAFFADIKPTLFVASNPFDIKSAQVFARGPGHLFTCEEFGEEKEVRCICIFLKLDLVKRGSSIAHREQIALWREQ